MRPMDPNVLAERRRIIQNCCDAGLTQEETAAVIGITLPAFLSFCRRQGIGWRQRRLLADHLDEIKRMLGAGKSHQEIADTLGFAKSAVQTFCCKRGLKTNRQRGNRFYIRPKAVVVAPTGEVEEAKRFLRSRGWVVYNARVTGGRDGFIHVGNEVLTEREVINFAQKLGWVNDETILAVD